MGDYWLYCSIDGRYTTDSIKSFLSDTSPLNKDAQEALLLEVKPVFTEDDNGELEATPAYKEIKGIVKKANHMAAPRRTKSQVFYIINALIFHFML